MGLKWTGVLFRGELTDRQTGELDRFRQPVWGPPGRLKVILMLKVYREPYWEDKGVL